MRREHDFYPTPAWATRELMKRTWIRGIVLEPCVGSGDIANELRREHRLDRVLTNDLDKHHYADTHEDATDPLYWKTCEADWVVTNPPFSAAHRILPLAHLKTSCGVAMLLRLTFLEPCEGRAAWLKANPPSRLIVLPRISFTCDGGTDSVTCAWFVWDRSMCGQSIEIVPPENDSVPLFTEATACP